MNEYIQAFINATDFSGRTERQAFWWFMLINLLVSAAIGILEVSTRSFRWLDLVYSLIVLLPFIAIVVRRLRDTGLSLWWFLILMVPGVGLLTLLVFLALPSQRPSLQEGVL